MATVKGRVTCYGKPVKEAAITFSPAPRSQDDREPGKPATGFTDAEGNYRELDGALVGQHRVLVTLDDTNPARCKRSKQLALEVKPGSNTFDIELDPR